LDALVDLTARGGTVLTLFGVERDEGDGCLYAFGYHAGKKLSRGRAFRHPDGGWFVLSDDLAGGLFAVDLPGASLAAPLRLLGRKVRAAGNGPAAPPT